MATMEKQKDRHKKKRESKQKNVSSTKEQPHLLEYLHEASCSKTLSAEPKNQVISTENINVSEHVTLETVEKTTLIVNQDISAKITNVSEESTVHSQKVTEVINSNMPPESIDIKLEKIAEIKAREEELFKLNAELMASIKVSNYSQNLAQQENIQENLVADAPIEDVAPSAPMFEEEIQVQEQQPIDNTKATKPKTQCMPIEEAIKIYGGAEMSEVKALSEKEEVIVEAGPMSGPEHPLVDLLSTFRSSLRALDNERSKLACGVADEEKSRSTLWRVEKKELYKEVECKCGHTVPLTARYIHATYLKERLPVAKLRLESLLRDVQDSYCHHQHTALLTHCQIEELISETIESNKPAIREALSLILQALRVSDHELLAAALQRWAAALVAALVDQRDVRQILFVIHHLFRQSRSVSWAARILQPGPGTPTTVAVLDTLLAGTRRDCATECTEDMEEAWEEVTASGGSGAVSEDCLRERDLLALLHVFPVRDILFYPVSRQFHSLTVQDLRPLLLLLDMEEAWEEVTASGGSGAVSEDCLRERDLIALLRIFPVRDIIANIVMIKSADIRKASLQPWGDVSGGYDVLAACCGARTLLATLHRAALAHPLYHTLHATLRTIAAMLLKALDCYYRSSRVPYSEDLQDKISAEMEACFVAAFTMFGARDLDTLNTALLTDSAARDYCLSFIVGLHDKSPRPIASMGIAAPVLPCAVRVRIVTHAAGCRRADSELARIVLDFLFQTGIKHKSPVCSGGCAAAACEALPTLLAQHDYLRTTALYNIADVAKVESLDASVISTLSVKSWRPQPDELSSVLHEWARRCPHLLPDLMMELDCTPYTGISHASQLTLLKFIVGWSGPTESRWRVVRRLRTHAGSWHGTAPCVQGPELQPTDMFECAFTLLATQWGCSIPLICTYGVGALGALVSRAQDAVHCLAPLMLVMAHSPESISYTPKFHEIFTTLLNSGPGLVQRALGRGGASGAELILGLALAQLEGQVYGVSRSQILSAWLHALSRTGAALVVDTVAAAARDWATIDAHAALLVQEENAKDLINASVRNASTAPLFCESMLRAHYTHAEFNTRMFAALSNIVYQQHTCGQKVHVDNALLKMKWLISSEELTIYRCATAAIAAPIQNPAHLTLWRLFLHLYLQRPPDFMHESILPVGPLFFSGMKKSRTLSQIKKRLQETAAFHHNEIETFKKSLGESIQEPNRVERSESFSIQESGLLPELSIKDLTGESEIDLDKDSCEEDAEVEEQNDDSAEKERQRVLDMICYHTGAERMLSEYIVWLDEGDQVRASPHHADIARFIPEQALAAAWRTLVARARPPAPAEGHPLPPPPPAPPQYTDDSPLKHAVDAICEIKDKSGIRSRRLIKSPLGEVDFKDSRRLLAVVDKHLNDLDALAKEWRKEVTLLSTLDSKLWDLTAALRVPRTVPVVMRQCPRVVDGKTCQKHVKFYFTENEWCISTGAERAIKENRSSWSAGVRRLTRARPHAARTAAALHSIASRIEDAGVSRCAVERAYCHARDVACPAAAATLTAFVQMLVQRRLSDNGATCAQLLGQWSSRHSSILQQALCGTLVAPHRVDVDRWPILYDAVLRAKLPPNTVFSFLSKFDMTSWSQSITPSDRRELLSSLVSSQQEQQTDSTVLLELLGVHTSIMLDARELCNVVMKYNEASVCGRMPPEQWTHLTRAVDEKAGGVSFDELGHLLREIGGLWWQVRSSRRSTSVASYAPHVANLLRALLRAFVAACVALSYSPERVGNNTWSAVQQSWSAWITPPSLLPLDVEDTRYSHMVRQFVACARELMDYCPDMVGKLLQELFPWCVHTYAHAQTTPAGRVQCAELLHALETLPWELLPLTDACLHTVVQMSVTNDKEIQCWCSAVLRHTSVHAMLCDVTGDVCDVTGHLAHRLATLLHLFTATHMNHSLEVLEQATLLPWRQLPEQALDEALDRFFLLHYNATVPYHQLPQFRVLLSASELRPVSPDTTASSRTKRARAVSQWTRALCAPAVVAHVADNCAALLRVITDIAPHLDSTSGELEQLLCRASAAMCEQPAAAALPVWLEFINNASTLLTGACITAACSLTTPVYAARLSDAAIKRHMSFNESTWCQAVSRWQSSSTWRCAQAAAAAGCAHAAYVCSLAGARARLTLQALLTDTVNFVEEEVIVAVWICYACRVALDCAADATSEATSATSEATSEDKSATGEREETAHAAKTLLSTWAQTPRRSILKVVTLQADTDHSTPQHRVLCRLAECILTRSKESIQLYTSAVTSLGLSGNVIAWGSIATPDLLPRLAVRLYPKYERYFTIEMEAANNYKT